MKYRIKSGAVLLLFLLALAACILTIPQTVKKPEDSLTILAGSIDSLNNYLNAVQKQFPEIELDIEYYSGPNTTEYINTKINNGDVPDLVIATNLLSKEQQETYLLDLSGYDFVDSYSILFQNEREIDGKIYLLPASYTIGSMYYNKTLFQEKGWEVPQSYRELLALIPQIRRESDLIPISFTGVFDATYFRMMTVPAQADFLTAPAGREWEQKFYKGTASAEEAFGESLVFLEELIKAGAFTEEDRNSTDYDVYGHLLNREAAIAFPLAGQSTFVERMKESKDEFGAIPIFGTKDGNVILTSSVNFSFGLGKQLGEPGQEAKLKQALEIMDYLSKPEGQRALTHGTADVLPLVSAEVPKAFPPYLDIWHYVETGWLASYLYTGYEDVIMQAAEEIKAAIFSGGSLEQVTAIMDEARKASLSDSQNSYLAWAEENFTNEQTVQLMADVMLKEGGGDLSLVSLGGCKEGIYNSAGVSGRLFAGKITESNYNIILPGKIGAELVEVTMKGSRLIELLEEGRIVSDYSSGSTVSFDYYWAGMEVTFQNGKVAEAVFPDGSKLEAETRYRVNMARNDFDEDLFSEVAETGRTVAGSYLEYLSSRPLLQAPAVCRE